MSAPDARHIPDDEALAIWRERWDAHDTPAPRVPSAWVMRQLARLAPGALVADLAGGDGRHAVPIAAMGHRVLLVDFVERAVRLGVGAMRARRDAGDVRGGGALHGVVAATAALPLRAASLDAIVIVNYLERALFPHLAPLLRPGGLLIVETFTTDHLRLVAGGRARGPRNARYMLTPGELPTLVAPLAVLECREEIADDGPGARAVGRVVAERRGTGKGESGTTGRGVACGSEEWEQGSGK